jgi:ABC-type molybdenum transport system ATPase subunit/photorepair protein PhrA
MAYSEELLLEIEGLEKSFADRRVLDGIDLQVNKGEVIVILGLPAVGRAPSCDVLTAWSPSRPDNQLPWTGSRGKGCGFSPGAAADWDGIPEL